MKGHQLKYYPINKVLAKVVILELKFGYGSP